MTAPEITENRTQSATRRRITILGATGSIGTSTADLVARNPETFDVAVLTANRNVTDLAALARDLRPEIAIVADDTCYSELKAALAGTGIEVAAGADALVAASR
ncbi:MAG: 1-deoxy-D-xylulose-5-phosphate reductoisomerase, partial [Alphaproteobacteria bacterium]|nr:1-deoxy-D-xylulose-5-phosphate reductoisomerase [Alphaproteobacteria bacterium]